MRSVSGTSSIVLAAALLLGPAAVAAEGDFEPLLRQQDGRYTKHGWNHYGPGHFELDPTTGVLTAQGGMGLFWYAARQYGDFELELEFKSHSDRTNSGIFLRVPEVPVSDEYTEHSFEIQIDEAAEGPQATGAVYSAVAPASNAARPPGQWNQYRISFIGNHITVDLNGTRVIDWQAVPKGKVVDFAPRGYIGLQNHGELDIVYFRNLRIREVESAH